MKLKEILDKIDNKIYLSYKEIKDFVCDCECTQSYTQYVGGCLKMTVLIYKIEGRYIKVGQYQGHREENEYYEQPVEVFPKEQVVVETTYLTKDELELENSPVIVSNNNLAPNISKQLYEFETYVKNVKSAEEKLKEQILGYMSDNKIKKFDNDYMSITYVEPSETNSFDSAKFKADYPELYNNYIKTSAKKEHIMIKIKKVKE